MGVRRLGPGDEDALVAVFEAVTPPAAGWLTGGPSAFLADPATFALAAEVDGEPAGLAWGLRMRNPTGRITTYLHQLEVRERFRRRGIASALVAEAMAWAREAGADRFWLSTGGHNEGAQSLYDGLGGERKPLGDVNYWWQLDAR